MFSHIFSNTFFTQIFTQIWEIHFRRSTKVFSPTRTRGGACSSAGASGYACAGTGAGRSAAGCIGQRPAEAARGAALCLQEMDELLDDGLILLLLLVRRHVARLALASAAVLSRGALLWGAHWALTAHTVSAALLSQRETGELILNCRIVPGVLRRHLKRQRASSLRRRVHHLLLHPDLEELHRLRELGSRCVLQPCA